MLDPDSWGQGGCVKGCMGFIRTSKGEEGGVRYWSLDLDLRERKKVETAN